MDQPIEAVYEHGVFKPLSPPDLPEGEHVLLVVEPQARGTPEEILKLASNVYSGLAEDEIAELESAILDRTRFSSDRPRD